MSKPKRKAPLAMAMLYGANPELAKDQEIARLKAENERLRKAGDAMDAYIKRLDGTTNGMLDCEIEWKQAKGVKS